jgi:tyrosyl-DNA phosphodiesterase-1
MDEAGPSKRAASPTQNNPPPQKPKVAEADVIDLTMDDENDRNTTEANNDTQINAPMHLFRVDDIPDWSNQGFLGARLGDLVKGNMQWALVSNYMIDMPWLLSACPDLVQIPSLVVCHGLGGGAAAQAIQKALLASLREQFVNGRATTHIPPVPAYGTHHSKAFLIQYPAGFRVIIHTANLLFCDCHNKSQLLYVQDFPLKESSTVPTTSPFEQDLVDYILALEFSRPQATKIISIIKMHDFSSARVKLIASVPSPPGEFAEKEKHGYLKLKSCLENEDGGFPEIFKNAPIACQYSSVGSLTSKWLSSFAESLSAGSISETSTPLGLPSDFTSDVHLIWPSAEEVQNSLEGWFAGRSIPGPAQNVNKEFLQPHYRRFGGNVAGRQRAMPHMKSYTRFHVDKTSNNVEIAWFCFGAHNLSKAAWGEEQNSKKYGREILKILSYELSVLLVPSLEKAYRRSPHYGFSCTDGFPSSVGPMRGSENIKQVKFVQWQRGQLQAAQFSPDGNVLTVPLPIPYPLPPESYAQGRDVPWNAEGPWPGLDHFGSCFPGIGTQYAMVEGLAWEDVVDALKSGARTSALDDSFY